DHTDSDGYAESLWTLGYEKDHVMKIYVFDEQYKPRQTYVYANTDVDIATRWVSNIDFPILYGREIDLYGRVLESNHFVTFSDGSSEDTKIIFSKIAEETFHEILQAFNIQDVEELGIIDSDINTKAKIFSNKEMQFPYEGFAYNNGYVVWSLDSHSYIVDNLGIEHYRRVIKHETMHLIQFLYGLDNLPEVWTDVWFSEGIATYISENYPPIANSDEFNEWLIEHYNTNPVSIHVWDDLSVPAAYSTPYYPAFALAVRYLLHENGHGKTYEDVKQMYKYMSSSQNGFAEAFEIYMGMSLEYYEENFFDLIAEFFNTIEPDTYK
ncbi:MAG: hypothetical protein GY863_17685, partial [bacterium]|nr:hypothetical protein [bacterium]